MCVCVSIYIYIYIYISLVAFNKENRPITIEYTISNEPMLAKWVINKGAKVDYL
jgi:hypothetical protein